MKAVAATFLQDSLGRKIARTVSGLTREYLCVECAIAILLRRPVS